MEIHRELCKAEDGLLPLREANLTVIWCPLLGVFWSLTAELIWLANPSLLSLDSPVACFIVAAGFVDLFDYRME